MQIQQVVISNVLGLARADILCTTPVVIVAGANEAGKSTLRDAISMAFNGTPCRVKLKKELGRLLHDDSAKGRVTIMANGDVMGDFKLPGGAHICELDARQKEFVEYVIDTALFARQDEAARRTALFKLTRCKASPDATAAMLIKRGISEAMAEEVKPMLRGGFPAACTEAKEQATQAKGAWRGITGENWGSDKANGWAPAEAAFVVDADDLAASAKQLADLSQDLQDGNQSLGATKSALNEAGTLQMKIDQLNELAGLELRRAAKLGTDETALAEWQAKLTEAEAAASGEQAAPAHTCPHCEGLLEIKNGKVQAYPEHAATIDPEAKKRAAEYRGYRDSAQRAVDSDKRDIRESQDATAKALILAEKLATAPTQAMVDNAETTINDLRQQHDALAAKVTAQEDTQKAAAERDTLISKAASYHAQVTEWLQVADALSPDGIPAEILASAISPVNDALAVLAGMAKWKLVQIHDDMAISVGGRLYGLMSE